MSLQELLIVHQQSVHAKCKETCCFLLSHPILLLSLQDPCSSRTRFGTCCVSDTWGQGHSPLWRGSLQHMVGGRIFLHVAVTGAVSARKSRLAGISHWLTKASGPINIFHEISKDQEKFLLSLADLNSSKAIFLIKSSEIVKKQTQPTQPP